MRFTSFYAGFVIFLLFSPVVLNVESLETSEFPSDLNKMEVNLPISIQTWGFNTSTIDHLRDELPQTIIQESYYPKMNETSKWQTSIENEFWGLENKLSYDFNQQSETSFNSLKDSVETVSNFISAVSPVNFGEFINGLAIPINTISNLFTSFSNGSSYLIHLANFTAFNTNYGNHWYSKGNTFSINSASSDMRNLVDLGNRQLLFDPSAIAPYFGIENTTSSMEINNLTDALTKIIEQLITGSPNSFNLLDLKESIQVDRIVIRNSVTGFLENQISQNLAYDDLAGEIQRLFPSIILNQLDLVMSLSSSTDVYSYINETKISNDENDILRVNSEVAEYFKSASRELHDDYPDGWYYGLYFFALPDLQLTADPDSYSEEIDYNVGELGFSAMSLKEWYDRPLGDLVEGWSAYLQMQLLAKTFGMAEYIYPLIHQIESPLSDYGVTSTWERQFSQFDVDQFHRRYAISMRSRAVSLIDTFLNEFTDSIYFWVDDSKFDGLMDYVESGDEKMDELDYTVAIERYQDAFENYEEVAQPFIRAKNFVRYGSLLMAFVILLFYYSDLLIQNTLSKKEFKEKVKEKNQASLNRRFDQ